jgi:protoporphyrin/coproporphyrin ferrochelatase
MSSHNSQPGVRRAAPSRAGVLLINLGTPDAPTPRALRRYLAEFLWDPRVVEIPRPLWWLILHAVVLRVRPRRSARLYQKIWMNEGSPLLVHSRALREALAGTMESWEAAPTVALAMRYGQPSISEALEKLHSANIQQLLVLPLYPQYAAATTGSAFDAVAKTLTRWRSLPQLQFVASYHDDPGYIRAMAARIRERWDRDGRGEHLLLSFHGLPERSRNLGDPYFDHCGTTAGLLSDALQLAEGSWTMSFQSRFGRAEWLQPYTSETLAALAAKGVKTVDVFCPGFAADCLETLEEIAIQSAELFQDAGGRALRYIPALNDSPEHARALTDLIAARLCSMRAGVQVDENIHRVNR